MITFPDFAWGVSQGDTEHESLETAQDLLQTLVQEYMDRGEALSLAAQRGGRQFRWIGLPALMSAKAQLYIAFREAGIRKAELARRQSIPKANIDHLFELQA